MARTREGLEVWRNGERQQERAAVFLVPCRPAEGANLEILHERRAGIGAHKETGMVCLLPPGRHSHTVVLAPCALGFSGEAGLLHLHGPDKKDRPSGSIPLAGPRPRPPRWLRGFFS